MVEHPQNARSTRTADRAHNSRRYQAAIRPQELQGAFRGGHRAGEPGAQARSSRVGRHHGDGIKGGRD